MINKENIISILRGKEPVSIVRCGDGEGIILNAFSSVQALDLANTAVLKRQLGFEPPISHIKEIRDNLIDCYNNADIIGIPNHRQEVGNHWKNVFNILYANCNKAESKAKCDIDVAYHMLEDDSYQRLLMNRKRLYYISCRDLDEGFKNRFNISYVNRYAIAPEAKFTSGYEGDKHYPDQFIRVQKWMDHFNKEQEPHLLLVGAGVIGKIYCNWWRDRGGIAMDVGGVMDCWAGLVTRGPDKGLDKKDETYKL
mgnify:CR=1 FL=1